MRMLLRLLQVTWTIVVTFASWGYLQTILRTDASLGDKLITIILLSIFICFAHWEYRSFRQDILAKIAEKDELVLTADERRELIAESTQIFLRGDLHPEQFKKRPRHIRPPHSFDAGE